MIKDIKCRLQNIKEYLHKDNKKPLQYVLFRDLSLEDGLEECGQGRRMVGEVTAVEME